MCLASALCATRQVKGKECLLTCLGLWNKILVWGHVRGEIRFDGGFLDVRRGLKILIEYVVREMVSGTVISWMGSMSCVVRRSCVSGPIGGQKNLAVGLEFRWLATLQDGVPRLPEASRLPPGDCYEVRQGFRLENGPWKTGT